MAVRNASAEANSASWGKLVYVIGYVILAVGAIYGDVMFITLLGGALPAGPLGIAAIIGAFLTSASLIMLVVGKSTLFRPGDQLSYAWIFTWIEIGVMSLNVILSALHGMGIDPGYLEYWLYVCPATPFVAVIGWILLIYADPHRHNLHEDMAMEDELVGKQRQHKQNVHLVRLELQNAALEQQKVYMQQYMQSEEVQRALRRGSEQLALGIVADIIQRPIMPAVLPETDKHQALPRGGKTIEGTAKRIDTDPRQKAVKRLPSQRRVTPRGLKSIKLIDDREVAVPAAPLAAPAPAPAVQIKKGSGPFLVNRRPAAALPTND